MAGRLASILAAAFIPLSPLKTFFEALAATVDSLVVGQQPSSYVWVAPNGVDATGERGNINRPFLTLAAAIAAAQTGDTILVAPGTYTTTVTPAVVGKNLTIQGLGAPDTCILKSTTGAALSCPGAAAQYLNLINIALISTVAGPAFQMGPGSNALTTAFLRANNVQFFAPGGLASSATLQGLANVELTNCQGSLLLEDVATGQIVGHSGEGNVDVNRAVDNAGIIYFRESKLGDVRVGASSRVHFDRTTTVGILTSNGDLAVTAEINFAGTADSVNFDYGGAASTGMSFDNATILGACALTSQAPPLGGGQKVSAKGAKFYGGIQASNTGLGLIVIDNRTGYCNMAASTWANAEFDRDVTVVKGVTIAAGTNGVAFGAGDFVGLPPFPGGASVAWSAQPVAALAAIADLPFPSSQNAAGCDFTSTAGTTADITIARAEGGAVP